MDEQKTMMFSFGEDKPKADVVIRDVSAAMREKGYNPINQLVGYLLSGDPAYVTSHREARSKIRSLERDDLLDELVRFYLEHEKWNAICHSTSAMRRSGLRSVTFSG